MNPFYITGGTLQQGASCYVEREADRELYAHLSVGDYCYVLTSRQVGKSSLMVRTARRLREEGHRAAVLDLTALGQNLTCEQWYQGLLTLLGESLDLEDELEEFWHEHQHLGPLHRLMRALREVVLPLSKDEGGKMKDETDLAIRTPTGGTGSEIHPASVTAQPSKLVVFIDEIDAVQSLPFSTDELFAAIRECYNRRSEDPLYQQLTFCLLGVASPADLIQDVRTTPFNIGHRIELTDFTAGEAHPLSQGLPGDKRQQTSLLHRILFWTGGHPYLTQRLCRAVAEGTATEGPAALRRPGSTVDHVCGKLFLSVDARDQDDNLTFVRDRLLRSRVDTATLLELYRQARRGVRIELNAGSAVLDVLLLSGVVRSLPAPGRGAGFRMLRPRNRIYEQVFDEQWIAAQLPEAELFRQRAAYRRGLFQATALYGTVALAMGGLAFVALREKGRADRALGASLVSEGRARDEAGRAGRSEREARQQTAIAQAATATAQRASRAAEQARVKMARLAEERRRLQVQADAARVRATESAGEARTAALRAGKAEVRAVAEAEKAREQLYIAQMSLMQQAYDLGNLGRARELLAAQQPPPGKPDLRDFEWRLFWQRCTSRELYSFRGHSATVAWTDYSPDGRTLATAGHDHTLRFWDVETRRELASLPAHKNWVTCVAFSPDGKRLATSGDDGQVLVWDAADRTVAAAYTCAVGEWPMSLDWSPRDGTLAWVTTKGRIYWVPPGASAPRRRVAVKGMLRCVAFSADGRTLAAGGSLGQLVLADGVTMKSLNSVATQTRDLWRVAFSPRGDRLATAGSDAKIRLWDARSLQLLRTLDGHTQGVGGLDFSRDGRVLVSGGYDQTVRFWDTASGAQQASLTGHAGTVGCVRFAPDGRTVLSAGADGTARAWNAVANPANPPVLPDRSTASAVAVSARRSWVAAGLPGKIRIWDPAHPGEAQELRHRQGRLEWLALSPDDRLLAGASLQTLKLWSLPDRSGICEQPTRGKEAVFRFSPDGKVLASLALDPGHVLLRSGKDWQVVRRIPLPAANRRFFYNLQFSPDGASLLANIQEDTVRVFRVSDGHPEATFRVPGVLVRSFRLSPDGRWLAIGGTDSTIRLWDVKSRREVGVLRAHQDQVNALAFTPSGRVLLSASDDGRLKFWNLALRQELVTLGDAGAQVQQAEFLPGGSHLLTRERYGEVRLYEATPEKALGLGRWALRSEPVAPVAGSVSRPKASQSGPRPVHREALGARP